MSITLAEAKYYLRIDDPVEPELDAELQSMIDAAIQYMEGKTGYIWTERDKTYFESGDGCVRIYDFPINTITTTEQTTEKNGYTLVETSDPVVANVGYADPADIFADIRQAALQLIKYWYYESEKTINTAMIPDGVKRVIDLRKRFIL